MLAHCNEPLSSAAQTQPLHLLRHLEGKWAPSQAPSAERERKKCVRECVIAGVVVRGLAGICECLHPLMTYNLFGRWVFSLSLDWLTHLEWWSSEQGWAGYGTSELEGFSWKETRGTGPLVGVGAGHREASPATFWMSLRNQGKRINNTASLLNPQWPLGPHKKVFNVTWHVYGATFLLIS